MTILQYQILKNHRQFNVEFKNIIEGGIVLLSDIDNDIFSKKFNMFTSRKFL